GWIPMTFVEVNPKYQELLREQALLSAGQFLDLPGAIISGHPDRNVAQVAVGKLSAFLKREHRIPWRDRLANAWAGFGFVSKSCREARTLDALARLGIGCPEWIAAGEDGRGRAFLLIRELTGTVDLRVFLGEGRAAPRPTRYRLARKLGEAIARLHQSGF